MTHLHMITFLMYHNNAMVYAISAQQGSEEEIDGMARLMCEKRGGIVSVYSQDDGERYQHTMWDFSYINSGDRTWKVTQDDLWNWEDEWEMSDAADSYFSFVCTHQPRSRLDRGKWLTMGEQVREFTPRAKQTHKRVSARKCRRDSRRIIQEQMM